AIGRDMVSLVVPPDLLTEGVGYSSALLRGEHIHAYAQRRRKDGSLVDVELWGVPVVVDGQHAGTILVYHDVTELLRAKETFESLVRNSPVAIVTWATADGSVASWNPAAEQLFGYTATEAIGRRLDTLVTTGSQTAEADVYTQSARRGEQIRVLTKRTR